MLPGGSGPGWQGGTDSKVMKAPFSVIDLHCDTLWRTFTYGGDFKKNGYHIDMEKLKKGGALAQFFAAFIYMGDPSKTIEEYRDYAFAMISRFYEEIEADPGLESARSLEDVEKNKASNKISAILTLEEGGIITSPEDIDLLFDKGVRLITLTWNFPNSLGYPNKDWIHTEKGLTSLGKDTVKAMEQKGILVDVSHLSDRGFKDVAAILEGPFLASHSCCRAITPHPRNLTDEMIRDVAGHGGVVGVNFSSAFLGTGETGTIEGIVAHMRHLKRCGGIEACALGSDFDGIFCPLELEDYSGMPRLLEAFKKAGFTIGECEKIAYQNVWRLMEPMGRPAESKKTEQ